LFRHPHYVGTSKQAHPIPIAQNSLKRGKHMYKIRGGLGLTPKRNNEMKSIRQQTRKSENKEFLVDLVKSISNKRRN
jgi:hypothetical protein